jgi:adenosylcobinamide-GDP ribazoletransferase
MLPVPNFLQAGQHMLRSFLGAVVFYTCIPLPSHWQMEFNRIARWIPCIGLLLGGFLGLIDFSLQKLGLPVLTRSTLVVGLGIALTGGLHLDGVSDTADGLAVPDPQKRLAVMQDSVTGAFGVMAVVVVLALKIAALSELMEARWLGLMLAAGWGRWGQVGAIAFYPYLKSEGKGAFHKKALKLPQDLILGLLFLLGLGVVQGFYFNSWVALGSGTMGGAIALLTGYWFYCQLGGHTGDTYGAVVEWTEALILCGLTALW